LDNGDRVGYRAYDDLLTIWHGSYASRDKEDFLYWRRVASAIEGQILLDIWLSPDEKDFSFLSYESYEDDNIEKLDNEYNILHSISLLDFLSNLENFDIQNINNPFTSNEKKNYSYLDNFLNEKINDENFINFIENKFFMKSDINEMYPEKVKNVFKIISKDVFNQFKILINRDVVKKDLIPLGLLFCKSSNFGKVKILHDINASPKFEKNENLFNFLKNMFILSILTENFLLNNVGEKHVNIDNNEILTISENLSNKFLNDFFKNQNTLTNEEFLKKFKIKTNEFGWIFNPNGIKKSMNKEEKFKMVNKMIHICTMFFHLICCFIISIVKYFIP
jgi:hypothetical protein